MAVTPIDTPGSTPSSAEARFDAALGKSQDASDDPSFQEALVNQAVMIGGQFIIMPKAQEMLNEAQSSDDDE
ncbi:MULTISPECIES: hypothetical protein [unclassified Pseudomonas]|uniref:hypothetical protein n=1 Tax=Pseudomonas TaxID=286 RepID=UPI0016447577|nr:MULTISPECIES: hypothetical protein [unclassified Pseudomonas]MBC3423549.1 hypothetical protein [Pseudomonas sp. RW3S2]MBC3464637.1 hypothetical protein [Pseudomonas sp. RW10S2]QXI42333.1 hypothetical protein HU734_019055 [Pseudomonas wayambapalatensis]